MDQFIKFSDLKPFKELQETKSTETTLNKLLSAPLGGSLTMFSLKNESYTLSESGFKSLYSSNSLFPSHIQKVIKDDDISTKTKTSLLLDYSNTNDLPVKVYSRDNVINNIVPQNAISLEKVIESINNKLDTSTLDVSTFGLKLSPEVINLRLIDRKTSFDMDNTTYYGGVHVYNNSAKNEFDVYTCLTNIYCFNTCLSKSTSFDKKSDVQNLTSALNNINTQSNIMFELLKDSKNLTTEHFMDLLNTFLDTLKAPNYVRIATHKYIQDHNTSNSLYDVIEALTRGTQEYLNKKDEYYTKQNDVEHKIFNIAHILNTTYKESSNSETWKKFYSNTPSVIKKLAISAVNKYQDKLEIVKEIELI